MIRLSAQQWEVVELQGHVVVTACPGSGKTRVLTARIIRGLAELTSAKHRVVAMTFTNRAADEIQSRLDDSDVSPERLWAGTIHGFALEWILRPYAAYSDRLRTGFAVADEYVSDRVIEEIRAARRVSRNLEISTRRDRSGNVSNPDPVAAEIYDEYQNRLATAKLMDYDDILFHAYSVLNENREIAQTLGSIIKLMCVDEIQDTQDLQYAILSTIFRASTSPPELFLVGDVDQCIYASLGAQCRSRPEIEMEFGLTGIHDRCLTGNYRSTQRIVDFFRNFRPAVERTRALSELATDRGIITLRDQVVTRLEVPAVVAQLVSDALARGAASSEICVMAPHWRHVRAMARTLVSALPSVNFDAPGLSPLHCQRENVWFKVARLFLTEPSSSLYRTRFRWANELMRECRDVYGVAFPDGIDTPRAVLRLINSIRSSSTDGLDYLADVFAQLLIHLTAAPEELDQLCIARGVFFDKAMANIERGEGELPTDVESFRRLFGQRSGVVVSTCHGVKGEEYETVIAFGLLRGFVPNWKVIMNGSDTAAMEEESRLLYVICSRAKRHLHLIAESGHFTRSRRPYETADMLRRVEYAYDDV